MANVLTFFTKITTFVFDVDGVLTDGTVLVLPGGVMARSMNIKDGYALQLAVKKGYRVIVISGGNSPEVQSRLENLGVKAVYMKVEDKAGLLQQIMQEHNLQQEEILYMGDDVPDAEVIAMAGLPCCPADAVEEIREKAVYISHLPGGKGCVRDVIEKTMKLRGNWSEDTSIRAQ
ncbi:KdsC family phosphatase [Sediminibacterium ginsengisoli]|uniref:3-deoxy-D-manno-octulosonate 8-phosphate phosphatase (KDO 8-P phosphatase) n=1 Tax=Sediminibacterium ginsengisoli TaxID=413434 RepID=A0A1T4LCF2_9BACT|nr:HAD family hydrolase [Sediminibacterium ginsengisoli]SJZ52194.1 3-deoxy-D-manno-octulosonate 8-phosphate phosphatase (KDO 8-P phosphatase) [Sediminibacterium ginsengisoli]